MARSKAGMSAGVWFRRYFSTNAATPLSASARATSQPSLFIDSVRKPPPGATITAAPVALPLGGRNGVRVATVTLRANTLPYCRCHDSCTVAPGSAPVSSTIASGCAGAAIGVILSSCAIAGGAKAHASANAPASSPAVSGRMERRFFSMQIWACIRSPLQVTAMPGWRLPAMLTVITTMTDVALPGHSGHRR
ncbi:hypothetical protein OU994_13645 [Pseudoduganella sp. SL102]|uniref:hypothetical protein n=1 Tax=Pseudoduganella sp. SL102 TaxID=2995154 RepID=UPI00248AFAFE|nr:hypothetical protein [Pseudoduganella sp. SL102]WBS05244.1 hypothetical protein OU994_13645 [Pseudoduganella sp. SL102]